MSKAVQKYRNFKEYIQNNEFDSLSEKRAEIQRYRGCVKERLRGYPRYPQGILDLHHCRYQEAMSMFSSFIRESVAAHLKTIRIITGRGAHSKNGIAVLREEIGYRLKHLKQSRIVRAYRLESFAKQGSYIVYL